MKNGVLVVESVQYIHEERLGRKLGRAVEVVEPLERPVADLGRLVGGAEARVGLGQRLRVRRATVAVVVVVRLAVVAVVVDSCSAVDRFAGECWSVGGWVG